MKTTTELIKFKKLNGFFALCFFVISSMVYTQPKKEYIQVLVAPDHSNWEYNLGEEVTFNVSILKSGNPVKNVKFQYEIRPEKMDIVKSGDTVLESGTISIPVVSMNSPGFLRCWAYAWVDGKKYTGYATVGFDPEKIIPTTNLPKDFKEFWENAKQEASKIPLDPIMTLLPEYCNDKVNVYHVSIQNYRENSRIYGMLAVPKKKGKYSALLNVPGAGVRAYKPAVEIAEKGIISLVIGIHGIPVNMKKHVYDDLGKAALNRYWLYNLDDRDQYYYKRVYLGCVRAVDFIYSLPEFDGENIAVVGGSQGGALSIITASLDPRIKWLGSFYPALCDLTGYLNNRAGGWPHMFANSSKNLNLKTEKIETSKYYDVVNFARSINIPGIYFWGYNDLICPPTSIYTAYNIIPAEKIKLISQDAGHWRYSEDSENVYDWLVSRLLEGYSGINN